MKPSAQSSSGALAEQRAAEYLSDRGYKIIDRNWRNRWCEIDIVATKLGVVHFIEVKFRKSDAYGSGFEYITREKQNRLARAAAMYMSAYDPDGHCQIDAISMTGSSIEYLENIVSA